MTIGEKIKNLRESLGLTQEELAGHINSTKQTIYKYENNIITNIPAEKIIKIADALKTTPTYLIGWNSNEESTFNQINSDNDMVKYNEIAYVKKDVINDNKFAKLRQTLDYVAGKENTTRQILMNLKELMKSRKISNEKLFEEYGISIDAIEQGREDFNSNTLIELANILCIQVWDLLGITQEAALLKFDMDNFIEYVNDNKKTFERRLLRKLLKKEGFNVPVASLDLSEELREEAEEEFIKLISTTGYEVTRLDNVRYKVESDRIGRSIIITKDELKILESNIMNYISYSVDNFFNKSLGFDSKK